MADASAPISFQKAGQKGQVFCGRLIFGKNSTENQGLPRQIFFGRFLRF
jgi:hypothetical protein